MKQINRREFMFSAGAAIALPVARPARRSILNFNENMEYRRLGKTGLWVSAVCMGGHWKRMDKMLPERFLGCGFCEQDYGNVDNHQFLNNRHEVVSRCIEVGINYIDACTTPEAMVYSKVLKGRRDKMYLGVSWHDREPREKAWRSPKKLIEAMDWGLKQTGLDYVDLWRITMPAEGLPGLAELTRIEEAAFEAQEIAKKQGKARFTGISTHNRFWLKSVIEQYPKQVEVVCTPYTADSKVMPVDSVFTAIRKHDVGMFGIKPFADNSLFKGDSSLNSPHREEDNTRARLALRNVLANPQLGAPIPGLLNIAQVDNAAKAIMERRKLDEHETSHLQRATTEMWANLRPSHRWLKDWEYL